VDQGDKHKHDELMMLYSASIQEIHNFKQQQWHVTNYTLLAYAGLFSLSRFAGSVPEAKVFLLAIMLLTAVVAGIWICSLDASIVARRDRMKHVREKHFSTAFIEARNAGPSEKIQFSWMFITIIFIGALLAGLFLFLPNHT